MRAAAEAERRRVAEEAAKERAKVEAARREAEAETAKQRAAAEAARQRADARAAEADQARRALEAQRAAEARARADADLARLRAEAEEAKRKAAAELAAAEEARRKAQAAAVPAPVAVPSLKQGRWAADINCPAFGDTQARNFSMPVVLDGDAVRIEFGEKGQPGSLFMRGAVNPDGSVFFGGDGVTGRRGGSRPYPASFSVRRVGAGYEGSGRLGRRECNLVITRTQ